MQAKGFRRGPKLVVCFQEENQVVIHDLENENRRIIEVERPGKCVASLHLVAVLTASDGLHLYTPDDVLIHIVPDSMHARCVAVHPCNTNILAIGYDDGSVRIWDISTQVYVSLFKEHTDGISNIRFEPYGRLFLSSYDKTASIVTLDDQFQFVSSVKFKGHTDRVFDILPLPASSQCVTCSGDSTIKVWDCGTGVCLRTLTQHASAVISLAMHVNGQHFASGSFDRSVIIWSSETFEVLRRISLPKMVHSLEFDENDTLYCGVYEHGVMSCNALTGEVGPVVIPATGSIRGLALGESLSLYCTKQTTPHSHS